MNQRRLYESILSVLTHSLTLNIFFWVIYAGIPLWINWNQYQIAGDRNTDILYYFQAAITVYINNYVLMPQFFDKKRYKVYFFCLGILLLVSEFVSLFIIVPFISPYLDYIDNPLLAYIYDLGDLTFFVLGFGAARLARQYIIQQNALSILEKQHTETQLAFLKGQLHPHLLFNTLNMIYSRALEHAPSVPNMILMLSQQMRYALYESDAPYVPIKKELIFIEDYISFQRIRLEGRGTINFKININGKIDSLCIAPMLLLPFLENAFKHTSSSKIEGILINIYVDIQDEELYLEVKNNSDSMHTSNHLDTSAAGIGLVNVRKRLALIYPGNHSLEVFEQAGLHYIQLWIRLITHPSIN